MTQLQFIDILKRNSIDDKTIDYILSKNIKRLLGRNLEEIEKIIKLLKDENIKLTNIKEYNINYIFYKFKYDDLKNILLHRKDIYNDDDIKLYIKLKYSINCYYDKQKLDEICNNLNINISKIIGVFKTKNIVLNEILTKRIYNENFNYGLESNINVPVNNLKKTRKPF